MKKVTSFLAAALIVLGSQSNAQILEPGNVAIDAYYGYPNLYGKIFQALIVDNSVGSYDLKSTSFGPMGIRGEFMVGESFGVGADICFSNASISYKERETQYDPNTGADLGVKEYTYKIKTSKIGAMVIGNYHFVNTEHFDLYLNMGIGYGNRQFTFVSDDPNYSGNYLADAKGFPVAARLGIGARYFFTPFLGASVNVGAGQGSLVNFGVSYKL